LEITQDMVNTFAEATGDHQWIHVDPERARKESPFGGPIAHGYQVTDVAGGVQLAVEMAMTVEGATKPACVATILIRQYT
jgi:acyl dehydratase